MSPFRLAILECDTPIDSVRERRGTYGDIFANILRTALKGLPNHSTVEPLFTSWDVVDKQEYPNLEQADGILLTGSSRFPLYATPLFFSPNVKHNVYVRELTQKPRRARLLRRR